jgi:hypothetical protein
MDPLTGRGIRTSFVNCTQGEAKRLHVPRDLAQLPWDDLDFLGWRDPAAPDRGYLVIPGMGDTDKPVGIALRATTGQRGFAHRSMCSICLTTHTGGGVALMGARKAGPSGRQGNSVGGRPQESLTLDEQIARALNKLATFVDKILY